MKNKIVFLVLAIFLLAGGVFYFLSSDEQKIRDNLDSLAEYCSSVNKESVLETLHNVTLAAQLCTVPCAVHIESLSLNRELISKEITDRLLLLKKRLPGTRFSFQDTVIDMQDEGRAEVLTTLSLNGKSVHGRFTDAYEMNIIVDKQDGDWLFSSFTVVEFMKK